MRSYEQQEKKRATTLLNAAEHSIGNSEGADAACMEIGMLLEDYESKQKRIEEILEKIKSLIEEIPMAKELLEIKGVGLRTVSGFLAEVGDVKRFNNPKELQKLAVLDFKENSSGKHKGKTKITKRGRKRLRYLLYEVVMSLISKNPEFKAIHHYYTTRKDNPLKKMQSIMAIAAKVIRVFFAILTKGVKYSPVKMIEDIKRPQAYAVAAQMNMFVF